MKRLICFIAIAVLAGFNTWGWAAGEAGDAAPVAVAVDAGRQEIAPAVETGSGVYYPTGTYYFTETDLTVAARSIPMVWARSYRSNRVVKVKRSGQEGGQEVAGEEYEFLPPGDGPLGYGWTTPWSVRMEGNAFVDADGRYYHFATDAAGNLLPDQSAGLIPRQTLDQTEIEKVGGLTYVFNWQGRLIAVRDPLGHSAVLSYNADKQLTAIADVTGRTVFTFTYNEEGRIARVADLAGRGIDYAYDAAGNLVRVNRGEQILAGYDYNGFHGMVAKINAVGETYRITYQYPDQGIVSKVINPAGTARMQQGQPADGCVTSFRYLFRDRIFFVTDTQGQTRKYLLNEAGKVIADSEVAAGAEQARMKVDYLSDGTIRTTDAAGNVTLKQVDAWGNMLRRVDAEGNETRFTYNAQGKPLTVTDPLGVVTRFAYDASGTRPVSITRAAGRPEEVVATFSYSTYGDLESTTVAGATTSFSYNEAGLPLTVTDPLGNKSLFEYDLVGNLTAAVDALGNRSEFTYDAGRNLLTVKNPLGHVTAYAYNGAGRLTSVTDPLGRVTRTETDFKGRVTAVIDALGGRQEFAYDGSGNLVEVVRGDVVTRMSYDGDGRLLTLTDPEGNVTRYEYAEGGCASCGAVSDIPKKIVDPFGNVIENLFDREGRVTGVIDPLQHLTGLALDGSGRVVNRVDANGKSTTYQYDGLGRVTGQVDAGGGITAFTYDKRGNLLTLTDPEGNATTFEYDLAGRKTRESRPMGQATSYAYYANGLLKTVKDAKNQTTTYTYDAASRLTEVLYADGQKDLFGYDAAGNLTAWEGGGVKGTMGYDPLGRKVSETVDYGAFTKSFAYTYDPQGSKATYTSPEGIVHTYTHDKAGKLTSIAFDGKTVSLAYDKTRLKQVTYPGGISSDYAYNAAGWLTSIDANGPAGEVLRRAYGFDNVGNILSKDSEHGAYGYGYDELYQLTSVDNPNTIGLSDEAFTYDKVGNRLTSAETQGSWSYNRNNELLDSVAATFEYDANGNTVKKIEGGQTTVYTYDARNRLTQVNLPDGTVATYAYDPFGRRVNKSVGGSVTWFVYTDEGLVGEYDASGMMRKVYGWKPDGLWGTDPLYMVEGGAYYFYHNDHLGTPQRLTSATDGAVVWSARYLAFGAALLDPTSTVENNLRFPGQYADVETGLYWNFQRFYDSVSGRYTQVDPIGFAGGVNYYHYVCNNTILYFDYNSNKPFKYTPLNGMKAHDRFFDYLKKKYPKKYITDTALGQIFPFLSKNRPDVLDKINLRVWELKPITHYYCDDKLNEDYEQIYKYINELTESGRAYRPGRPKDLIPEATYVGNITDTFGNVYEVVVWPGRNENPGMLFYELKDTERNRIKESVENFARDAAEVLDNNNKSIGLPPGTLPPIYVTP